MLFFTPTSSHDAGAEQALAAYLDWREACIDVQQAYDRSTSAPGRDRQLAHAAYQAALDRESRAAGNYRNMLDCAAGS